MELVFDTSTIAASDRREYADEFINTALLPLECQWAQRPYAFARVGLARIGGMMFCDMQTSLETVTRTATLARDASEPCIGITVRRTGSCGIVQGDNESVVRPGDLVLTNSSMPFAGFYPEGSGELGLIPLSALDLPHDLVARVCGVRLCPGHPLTTLIYEYLYRIAADPSLQDSPDVDPIGAPGVDLIRAVITTHVQAEHLSADPLHNTLQLRILEYVRKHLGDPDMSAAQIAAAHHISVRYLYKILADGGVSLADWIRTRRLEACRRELSTSSANIAVIARRNGFTDMSSFSRAFRAQYGVSPREWRRSRANNR